MNEDDLPDSAFPWIADIRDDVLAQFLKLYPRPLHIDEMAGYFTIDAILAQLVIAELMSHGFLDQDDDGSLLLSAAGHSFASDRLIERPGWAGTCTRPSAPPWPEVGRRLSVAMDIYAARHSDGTTARLIREMRSNEARAASAMEQTRT